MSTAYTSILKLALPTTGELAGTWGTVVNDNITQMIEQAIAGLATINTWTTNSHTLTVANGTSSESRCAMLVASDGAGLSAAGEIICPAATKLYVLKNGTSYQITLKTASGTGIAVPTGQTAFLFCDGTNVLSCTTGVTTFSAGTTGLTPSTATSGAVTLAGTLAIANGGTGQTTATAAFNALVPSQTSNSGKYLTTDGTNTSWATVSGGTPAGSTTQVQYNNAGAFGASSNFTWDNSTSTLSVNSVAIGRGGGGSSTSTAVGTSALGTGSTTGVANTAFGYSALAGLTSGSSNIGIGVNAGNLLAGGGNNILIGNYAGDAITSGYYNIAIGGDALGSATTGASYNVAIGQDALKLATNPGGSVAIGHQAADSVTSGTEIVAIGQNALAALVGNGSSVAVGTYAGAATTGDANTLIGNRAGINLSTGANNVGIGNSAFGTSSVTGNFNVAIGEAAASTLTSGSNNIILGYNATSSSATVSNEITLGNSSIATLRCQVTSITALSDARDKKDVQNIPLGVDFIQRLRPVSFVWNTRDGAKVDVPEFGFIAQELQSAQRDHGVTLPGLVHDVNPDRLEAAPGTLIPVLVKAVQELQAQIDVLKQQLAARG